jgi:His-Xaa-Ser system radical SAM maturase HxsB
MKVQFYPADCYRSPSAEKGYRLLPFRFMRFGCDEVLMTNDGGEFVFLPREVFDSYVNQALSRDHPDYRTLKAKHFLTDSPSSLPLELLATQFRTKKAFLEGFTKLHLFVVTLRCDHSCPYCQVSRVTQDRTRYDMTWETADRAISLMFRSPSDALKVEFQGGEPLLNFDLIRKIVLEIDRQNGGERHIDFVIATNLSQLTDEILAFCAEHQISLSTSLDGPEALHNSNRPRPGRDSHQVTVRNLERARAVLGQDRVAALMTTTAESLCHPREIVDEYVRHGFDSIFLRSISPYGFALRSRQTIRYQTEQFLDFYRVALDYIIELNRRGTPIIEVFSQILLQKILTPFPTGYVDLQSPAGAAISVVAYNYDGEVFASDEARMLAEMGDRSFRLGNVATHTYEEIFAGPLARCLVEGSCAETLPGCSECAFVPYCGSDPVFHWATQGDPVGHRPTSAFCAKHMGVFRHLLQLIRSGDSFTRDLLVSWATQEPMVAA